MTKTLIRAAAVSACLLALPAAARGINEPGWWWNQGQSCVMLPDYGTPLKLMLAAMKQNTPGDLHLEGGGITLRPVPNKSSKSFLPMTLYPDQDSCEATR